MKKTKKAAINYVKAVADDTRLKVVGMLLKSKDGIFVSEFIKKLKIEPTLLSHHLLVLKDNNLIFSERMGQTVKYKINPKSSVSGDKIGVMLGKFTLLWP